MTTGKDLEKQIKETQEKLNALRQAKKKLDEMAPEYRLATELHNALCHWNHTDGCSWFYTEDDWNNNPQKRYLAMARKVLAILSQLAHPAANEKELVKAAAELAQAMK